MAVKDRVRSQRGNKNKATHAKREEFIEKNSAMRLLGEIITWGLDAQTHPHLNVVKALRDSSLSTEPAKEMLPRHAFTRASKKLTEEKVIDEVGHDGDLVSFQFTKRYMAGKEMKYAKECVLILNKSTGDITCENKELEKLAQGLLNHAIENRTTADITKIIQKLFESNGDLFPIRDQGGVYFVPDSFKDFTDKIETFVKKLGGRVNRFPVPADTKRGDESVQDAIVNGLTMVVMDLQTATENFDVTTRADTLTKQAERIKAARVKVEAYANYLQDKAQEMLDQVDLQNDRLRNKITSIEKERASAPPSANGANRTLIFGFSPVAVIRWMASEGWTTDDVRKVLDTFDDVEVADNTISCQVGGWQKRGEPAKLTDDQKKDLKKRKDAK